jgi:flagellar hook protein FlgE
MGPNKRGSSSTIKIRIRLPGSRSPLPGCVHFGTESCRFLAFQRPYSSLEAAIRNEVQVQTTGIRWHLAINGEGFFALDALDGSGDAALKRDGTFALDEHGYLCESVSSLALLAYPAQVNGMISQVEPPQPIKIPYVYMAGTLWNITIDADGTIAGAFTNGHQVVLGRIALATRRNRDEVPRFGFAGSGRLGFIEIGALERCNVPITGAFTKLLLGPRSSVVPVSGCDAGNR